MTAYEIHLVSFLARRQQIPEPPTAEVIPSEYYYYLSFQEGQSNKCLCWTEDVTICVHCHPVLIYVISITTSLQKKSARWARLMQRPPSAMAHESP